MLPNIAAVVFASSLLCMLLTERTLNTILALFFSRFSATKNLAAKQVVISQIEMVGTVVTQSITVASKASMWLISWWILVITVFVFFSLVHVSWEETPQVWMALLTFYNTAIGPWLAQVLTIPLYILDLFLRAILPFWNAITWFLKTLVSHGFLPMILDEIEVLLKIAVAFVHMAEALAMSLIDYAEGFGCQGSSCLIPAAQLLNLVTPIGHFKEMTAYTLEISTKFCSYTRAPLDILMYPFLDMNFAMFVHNLVNGFLEFLIGVPQKTVIRCGMASDNTFKIMMCTPDFSPAFRYFVAALTYLGLLIDNWLNIILVIVQDLLTGTAPVCEQVGETLMADIMQSDLLFPSWRSSRTVVIGLTAWMYAITDGSTIVYKGHSSGKSLIKSWPYAVDTTLGVAAVAWSSNAARDVSVVSDGGTSSAMQTTSLFGCNCSDVTEGGIEITCTTIPIEGWTTATRDQYISRVIFPNEFTQKSLRCKWVDIHVRSSRFSFQRFSTTDINYGSGVTSAPTLDCISKGNCREVDATVWIVPRCGQDIPVVIAACVTGSECFPYCMAARLSGSTNQNMLLSSASRWKQGKVILNRDCNIYNTDPSFVSENQPTTYSTVMTGEQSILGVPLSASVYAQSTDTGNNMVPECYAAYNVISMGMNLQYASSVYNTYSSSQPFVITGDVLFTPKDLGGNIYSVVIDRLQSDEKNTFTMTMLTQEFPTEPPLNVLSDEIGYVHTDKLLLPYGTRRSKSVAVSTRNYVFYASNPDYGVFSAYFDYCTRDPNMMPRFGLIIRSSYGPLRIYRVKAYAKCSAMYCGAGLVKSVDFDEFRQTYDKQCDQEFNTSIVQLEYLNEDNIAVVVAKAKLQQWDTNTLDFSSTSTQVYWLNPETMQVSTTIWQTTVGISNLGALCPGMQRLPRVGSFFAELGNSILYLVEYVLSVLAYFPGIVFIWKDGGKCPQQAYSHSVLENCGQDFLSLDDFFDSLADASSIFWHSLNCVSYFIQVENAPSNNPLVDVINGMAEYGEGTVDMWAISNTVVTLSNVPIKSEIMQLMATLQSGGSVIAMENAQENTLMWGRFMYKTIIEIILVIIKSALKGSTMTTSDVYREVWTTLYNLKGYYKSTVVNTNQMACSGIQLMFGVDNPWASLAYYVCTAQTSLFDNVLDTMLSITVYIPMTVCLCKNSRGLNVVNHAVNTCAKEVPANLRPQLYLMSAYLQEQGANSIGMSLCGTALEYTRNQIKTSLDPWFSNMNQALTHMSACIDYLLIMFDHQAGKCTDFQGSSHVISIVPQPVDYFQSCGITSLCKMKCASEWQLFNEVKTSPVSMPTVDTNMESMFFPGEYTSDMNLYNASAVLEIQDNNGYCVVRDSAVQQDYILFIAEVSGKTLNVKVWCVPQAPMLAVYVGQSIPFPSVQLPGDVMQSIFVNSLKLALLLRVGTENHPYIHHAQDGLSPLPNIPGVPRLQLITVLNIWPLVDSVFVDVVMRGYESDVLTLTPVSYMYHYFLDQSGSFWISASSPDLSALADNYMLIRASLTEYSYLLLPRQSFFPVYYLSIDFNELGLIVSSTMNVLASFDPNTKTPELYNSLMASNIISPSYVFVVNPTGWDWLKQLRFSVNTEGVPRQIETLKNSLTITMQLTRQGNCDEKSCEGCKTLYAQRVCQAYNKCALVRCVGTLVNQMRPLCAIGQTLTFQGTEALTLFQGGWIIIAEMLAMSLKLGLSPSSSTDIEFIDDVFMGYMCNAKDKTVEFWAIFTSIMNAVLHWSVTNPRYALNARGLIDKNTDASLTIRATAMNAFLSQFTLLPIYKFIALKQILTCQVNGILSLLDSTGLVIRFQSANLINATDVVAGSCLVLSKVIENQAPDVGAQGTGTNEISSIALIGSAAGFLAYQAIDPLIHLMDAALTYMMGIIHSLAGLLMSLYPDKCNAPDYFLKETVNCVCDDDRLSIPDQRANEGIEQFALWCTGSLGMIDNTNTPIIVVNPFTFQELREMLDNMQTYVECISQSYDCDPPVSGNRRYLENQGVTLLNVFVKCRENYMKRQWDPKSYAYFDINSQYLFKSTGESMISSDSFVKSCLLESYSNGMGPEGCQEQYINSLNYKSADEYWTYSRATRTEVQYTDACVVFSGPGKYHGNTRFAACLDGDLTPGMYCDLNAQVWTPQSENDVPVAEPHIITYDGQQQADLVNRYYQEAHDMVISSVLEAIYVWSNDSNPAVQVDFFSTEGDAIHQILDCIFMGPYSRVNYWPIPKISDNMKTLYGPAWYRDENKGKSRSIDVNTCDGGDIMPFSCGSKSRRSAIKYFVKNMLSGQYRGNSNKTLIQKVVLQELRDIYDVWDNLSHYGCLCSNSDSHSPLCCDRNNQSEWLSSTLSYEFHDIHSDNVIDALDETYEEFYNLTLQDMYPWVLYNDEWKSYNWVDSQRARDEGILNPTKPAYDYNDTLTMDMGDSGLWALCHASLKQIFFTIPLQENTIKGFEKISLYDGDPEKVHDTIQHIVEEALKYSPTYRHYYARYHPSPSLLCEVPESNSHSTLDFVNFQEYLQGGTSILAPDEIMDTGMSVWDYKAFALGNTSCTCGWSLQQDMCVIPGGQTCAEVCALLLQDYPSCAIECKYPVMYDTAIQSGFSTTWFCPVFELSPFWGILDPIAMDEWLQGKRDFTLDTREFVKYGRGGMRLGNINDINQNSKAYVNENLRSVPLEHGILTSCSYDSRSSQNLTLDAMHLAEELFPLAHAAQEGGVSAYCLRYFIEKARFMVLHHLTNLTLDTSFMQEYLKQEELMYSWARKCGSQLYLLHLCTSLDVFQPAIASNEAQKMCMYFEPVNEPGFYSTPECLVNINDQFYDPCRCMPCIDAAWRQTLDKTFLQNTPACQLRFDPRNKSTNWNAPIGWWEGEELDRLEYLNITLLQSLLDDPDAVGNTPAGKSWMHSEGFMAEQADECDMIVDYWPDTMDYPVGYHVSTTCDIEDNAYRSFSSSFMHDIVIHSDGTQETVFRYAHDTMRDSSNIDTVFGTNGLCRKTNFGMNMLDLNTIVYCTRTLADTKVDYTVPAGFNNFASKESQEAYTPEQCTTHAYDVPWESGPGMKSVGILPHLPSITSSTYPETLTSSDMFDLGSDSMAKEGWGSTCADHQILLCNSQQLCPVGYGCRGRRCVYANTEYEHCTTDSDCLDILPGINGTCTGVCLRDLVECIRHYECDEPNHMCSGLGKCMPVSIIVFNNDSNNNFSLQFQVYQNDSDTVMSNNDDLGTPYTLQGASYWGNMGRDLLSLHGMCSYTNWYKYKKYYRKECVEEDQDTCWIDPTNTVYRDLQLPESNHTNYWWGNMNLDHPALMYIRPTVCDRDYEHLRDFTFYRPNAEDLTFLELERQQNKDHVKLAYRLYDNYTRAYSNSSVSKIPLAKFNITQADHFVYDSILHDYIANPSLSTFRSCSSMRQCVKPPFTRQFQQSIRTIKDMNNASYNNNDNFICGAIGYLNSEKTCSVDTTVFPLYQMFCKGLLSYYEKQCPVSILAQTVRADLCNDIVDPYPSDYNTIAHNVDTLNKLLFMFTNPLLLEDDIMQMTECALQIYDYMKLPANQFPTSTLYYAFPFVLKEIPFDFYFQCFLLNTQINIREDITSDQTCVAYKKKRNNMYFSNVNTEMSLVEFLRVFRGGLTISQRDTFVEQEQTRGLKWIQDKITPFILKYGGNSNNDQSRPVCSSHRAWKTFGSSDVLQKLKLLYIYNFFIPNTCSTTRTSQILKIINARNTASSFSSASEVQEIIKMLKLKSSDYSIDKTDAKKMYVSHTESSWAFLMSETLNTPSAWSTQEPVAMKSMFATIIEDIKSQWTTELRKTPVSMTFQFNVAPLPDNFKTVYSMDPNLDPATSIASEFISGANVYGTETRCACLDPEFDPVISNNAAVCVEDPNTLACTCTKNWVSSVCTKIPVYSHSGRFYCHYRHIFQDVSSLDPTDVWQVYTYIYNYIKQTLTLSTNALFLQPLAFFVDTDWQTEWQFDFADILSYNAKNQPDTTKSVMCVITDVNIIDYSKCNHPHWFRLKQHVEKHYLHQGGVIIPASHQMQWMVKKSMFHNGFITSFSSMNRTDPYLETYLKQLFSEDRACLGDSNNDWKQKVCYSIVKNGQAETNVINPWLHGFYNPYDKCDVSYSGVTVDSTEFIDTYIYSASANDPNFPPDMPNGEICLNRRNEPVTRPGPSRFSLNPLYPSSAFGYNLCHHTLIEYTECTHDQGLLGNDNGMPVGATDATFNPFYNTPYTTAYTSYRIPKHMYERVKWEIPSDFQTGLFGNTNPLWQGKDSILGFLKVPPEELGITTIVMALTPPNVSMYYPYTSLLVSYLPLASFRYDQYIHLQKTTKHVSTWVPSLISDILSDHSQNQYTSDPMLSQSNPDLWTASCPLRRTMFYGRRSTIFRPSLPSPVRAKFMFYHMNRDSYAHPTMTHTSTGNLLGGYKTVNGFCYCPWSEDGIMQSWCKVPVTDSTHPCSLRTTIQTLLAKPDTWIDSYTFPVMDQWGVLRPCTMQLDWPFITNSLRDGSLNEESTYISEWNKASDPQGKKCHVLDRIGSFQYKYKNTKTPVILPNQNTVTHGVCKTSRLSSLVNARLPPIGRCALVDKQPDSTIHQCENEANPISISRPKPVSASTLFTKYRRVRRTPCSTCSSPPRFVDTSGNTLPPESSFGIPYKISVSKMLMADLRRAFMLGNISQQILDETFWTPELFLKTYLQTPSLLIKSEFRSQSTPTIPTQPQDTSWKYDDSSRWTSSNGWVYCPTVQSFQNNTCLGVISRADWKKSKTKICPSMIKYYMQTSQQDPMSHASFSTIDQYTNKVSNAIIKARELVIQANCIASGNAFCLPRPFTYHPASYETTNRAWIHDTVMQYYYSINESTCPVESATSQALLTYLTSKQMDCPANNVYLFEYFLRIVRKFSTELAILLSNLVTLLVYVFLAPFNTDARNQMILQWAKMSQNFHSLFATMSDMVIHMLMNSGQLGNKLIRFIQSTCSIFNDAFKWFTDTWCIYVQKYLTSFIKAIHNFVAIAQGGFLAIQEFLHYLLRYYLPVSMIQGYVSQAMQARMVDKYGEPSDDTDRKKDQNKMVDDKPVSRQVVAKGATGAKGAFTDMFAPTKLKEMGKVGLMAGALMITDTIMDMVAEASRGKLIDHLWTAKSDLFDFQKLYDLFDNIIYFLTDDTRCTTYLYWKEYTNNSDIIKCPKFDLDTIDATSPAKSITPTMCWATSNPSLGESSMFSCTASSTCCPETGCSSEKENNVICSQCPFPSNPGLSRFACDNMYCKCSVPIQITSQCISNDGCSFNSFCDLITEFSSSISFGTLPCSLCPGKTVCIATSAGSAGRCGCLMDKSISTAQCFDSPGTLVYPNPNHLCGYMPRLSSSSSQSSFQYMDLMAVLCIKSFKTICARVYMDNGIAVNMPVSLSIRLDSGRRRLLGSQDTEKLVLPSVFTYENEYDLMSEEHIHYLMTLPWWNQSSAPCKPLAQAYQNKQKLTILEKHELQKCAYWRWVGQSLILEYNLTSLHHHETFLISYDDFSAAITQKNVLWQLASEPGVVFRIILMHPYLKPLRAFFVVITNIVQSIAYSYKQPSAGETHIKQQDDADILTNIIHDLYRLAENESVVSYFHSNYDYYINTSNLWRKSNQNTYSDEEFPIKELINKTRINRHKLPQRTMDYSKYMNSNMPRPKSTPKPASPSSSPPSKQSKDRKLLATLSDIQAIRDYSASIIAGEIAPPVALTASQSWLRGPFVWPPKYSYSITDCPIIEVIWRSFVEVFEVLTLYFKNFNTPYPKMKKSLRDNLPQIIFPKTTYSNTSNTTTVTYQYKSLASRIYHEALKFFNIQPSHITHFLLDRDQWTLIWIAQTVLVCDYGSVMSCSRRTKDLFMSFIVFILFYFIILFITASLGFSSLATLFLTAFPLFILWYTYGFSPACLPMLPTCLMSDITDLINTLLPAKMSFPADLYCSQAQTYPNSTSGQCLKSCTEVGFTSWYDPLTYSLCSLDSPLCYSIVNFTNSSGVISFLTPSFLKWYNITSDPASNLDAYKFCTFIQFIQVIPFLILLLVSFVALSASINALVSFIPIIIRVFSEIIAFNHTK